MLVRSASLLFAAIVALLLLAATAGCTGGGEPEAPASPAAVATTSPAATATTSPAAPATTSPAATATSTVTATATPTTRPPRPVDISFGQHILTEGSYKYSLGPRTSLFFDVPAGLRLEIGGQILSEGRPGYPGTHGLQLADLDSRSWITFDLQFGTEWSRWIDPDAPRIVELFGKLAASVRVDPPPTPTPDPRVMAELWARREAAEAAAPPIDISGWQFTKRWLNAGSYQLALNPDEQPLIFEVPAGLLLNVTFTGSMLDAPDRWCPGLRLVEIVRDRLAVLWGSVLCLDVHHAVELSRTIHEKSAAAEDRFNRLVESLRLGSLPSDDAPAHCNPVFDASYSPTILTGGSSYVWPVGTGVPPPFAILDIPVGITLALILEDRPDGSWLRAHQSDAPRVYGQLHLKEADSGSRLVIDLATGEERERELLPVSEPYRIDVGAAFDQILASLRFDELPSIPGCPAPVVPSLAQTLGAGVYRYLSDPDRYPFTAGLPDITFEVPAGLQLKVSWDDETAHQVRLTDVDTDSWLCLDAALLVECGRSVTPGAEHVGPLFDQIAESLRLGRLRD